MVGMAGGVVGLGGVGSALERGALVVGERGCK